MTVKHAHTKSIMDQNPTFLDTIRRSLGRTERLKTAPVPPVLDEPIIRLVNSDIGLPELFAKRAEENKMHTVLLNVEELAGRIVDYLREKQCRKIAMPVSKLLDSLEIGTQLKDAGFDVKRWDEMSLDELYEVDCGVTDAYAAVAETSSIVIKGSGAHGRSMSLVPPFHVAVLEPRNFVPDLVDMFEKLSKEGGAPNVTLISGPSKTSDIEMNLVVGVHGPCEVQIFILQ